MASASRPRQAPWVAPASFTATHLSLRLASWAPAQALSGERQAPISKSISANVGIGLFRRVPTGLQTLSPTSPGLTQSVLAMNTRASSSASAWGAAGGYGLQSPRQTPHDDASAQQARMAAGRDSLANGTGNGAPLRLHVLAGFLAPAGKTGRPPQLLELVN